MAIERAKYSVVIRDAPFEIRDYSSAVVAVVVTDGSRGDAVSAGFRPLAQFIFGKNQQKTIIAMTAPVMQVSRVVAEDAKVDPSTPSWDVRFIMPSEYTLQSLPRPIDGRVHFEQMEPRRIAVVRFSGFWSDDNLRSHASQLLQWMKGRRLTAQSPPIYAYYDPPWTPWFMRTNEILIEIAPLEDPKRLGDSAN